jgi:phage terminase large subunit
VFERVISVEIESDSGEIECVSLTCLIVVSTYKDNKYLTPEQKADIEELKKTDPEMYEMLGEGKFVKPAGTYFSEFSKGIHVIEPFIIPEHWRRYRAIDYGLDMLACYWIAQDGNNKAYVYKELYQSGLIISEAANRMVEITNEPIYETAAPPDLWNKRQETGKSAAEIFGENGVWLSKASNNRVQGWYNLKEWLKPYTDEQGIKKANIVFFKNCTNIIRTLPQLQRDEKNPNDVANEPHELTHAPDAIRYFVAARPTPKIVEVKKKSNLPPELQTGDREVNYYSW